MTSFLNNHKQRETDENNDTHKGIENGKPLDIPRFLRKGGKVERVPKFVPRAGRYTRRKAAQ